MRKEKGPAAGGRAPLDRDPRDPEGKGDLLELVARANRQTGAIKIIVDAGIEQVIAIANEATIKLKIANLAIAGLAINFPGGARQPHRPHHRHHCQ